jgi:hypothetical protein
MKPFPCFASWLGLALALPLVSPADPLPAAKIPADAKWVLHLDADAFRRSKIGEHIVREVLDPKSAKAKEDLEQSLGFALDWTRMHSITLFGPTYQPKADNSGLALIRTSMNVVQGLDTAIERNNPALRPEQIEAGPTPLYRINKDSYVWAGPGGWFLLGKSRDALDRARAALTGSAPSLATANLLKGFGPAQDSFFFLGLAEDFGQKADLPLKAAVLKQAEGGRLVLGERGDQVFAQLTIRTRTAEAAQQIQQVVQGLIALGALSQDAKPELQELAQGAKVTAADQSVTISLEIPSARALAKIAERK